MAVSKERLLLLLVAVELCLVMTVRAASIRGSYIIEPANLQDSPYPPWAHYHWVWLSAERANQTSMLQYAQEYLDHNITVGAVDLDSSWATGFNTFQFNPTLYPDPASMINTFHSQNIRVILWVTSMINTDTDLYEYASDNHYMICDAFNKTDPLKWWHGKGGLLDYTNPNAVAWWHGLMDPILDLGIDGWKCDGTDPYLMLYLEAKGYGGVVSYREYADLYYGDFMNYTRQRLGDDRLIMSRPVDGSDGFYLQFSPRNVVFSGWVGDEDPTFNGLIGALNRILMSAWSNYVGFGSDIGGYRSGPGPLGRTKELFTRWFQLGAFSSLMENGGNNEHRPWMFDDPNSTTIVDTYRTFVSAHTQLVPYLLSAGTDAYYLGGSIITPLAANSTIIEKYFPNTYAYLLGPDIFVSPITDNVTTWNVSFPNGSNWVDYWNPTQVYQGNTSQVLDYPLTSYPVFMRTGAIVPLNVTDAETIYGDHSSADALTILLNYPSLPSNEKKVYEFKGEGLIISYKTVHNHSCAFCSSLHITVTAQSKPLVVLLHGVNWSNESKINQQQSPFDESMVTLSHLSSTSELQQRGVGFTLNHKRQQIFIRPQQPSLGVRLDISGIDFM